jgi:hypothetical protein
VSISEIVVAAAVTVSVGGVCYAALNPDELMAHGQAVADEATCHTVDTAIVAYVGVHDDGPTSIADLAGYVKGDISAYQIVDGLAAGPGC